MLTVFDKCLLLFVLVFASLLQNCAGTTSAITTTANPIITSPIVYNCTGQNLTNTVVYEGTTNTTFPRLNNGQAVQWQVIQSSDIYNSLKSITNYDDNVTSQFVPAYAVNGSGLMVFNATVAPQGSMSYSTAGVYVVKYRNPNCSFAANLIVIRSGPICSCNASDPNNVKLSCSVDYAESNSQPNNPIFKWKNSSSVAKQEQPIPTSIGSYLRRSTSQFPVSSTDSTTYECQLTFSTAPKSPMNYLTATAPNFTASCYISNCAPLTTVTKSLSAALTTVTTLPSAPLTTVVTTLPNEETTALALKCADQNLTNTVVYEGSPASFPRVKNGQPVKWEVSSSSDLLDENQPITNYDDNVVSQFTSTYAVTQSQLTIFNATVEPQGSMSYATAGLYTLSYQDTNCITAANLIVIRSGPVCSCNASDPNKVKLSCSVDYAESSSQPNNPVFTWKTNRGSVAMQEQRDPTSISSYLRRSTSQFPLFSNDLTTYECQLTFASAPKSPANYLTTKEPNFTASCFISSSAALTTVTTLPSEETTAAALNCADQNLMNTVVYEGSPTSFPSVNNGQAVKWEVSSSSDFLNENQPITNYDDTVVPQFSSTYAVTKSQLTIFNATTEPQGSMPYATAGLYTLSYQHTNCITAANLIVIRSGPTCSCSVNDTSSTATLYCSVDFAGVNSQPNYPIFTWSDGTSVVQQDQPVPAQINSYLQESASQHQISSNDPTTYRCQLTFGPSTPSPPSNIATNAPDFTATCDAFNCTKTISAITTTANPISTSPIVYNCTGQNLTNTVVYEGTTNTTFPRLNNGQAVQWQVIQSSDIYNSLKSITNYDDNVTSQYVPAYAVNGSRLMVFNATVAPQGSMSYSTAGVYVVKYRNPNCSFAANLIVIRSGPVCSCNASDPNNVKLSCSVDYAESNSQPNNPVFTWKSGSSVAKQQQPLPTSIGSYLRRSTSQLQLSSTDSTTYECQLTFASAPKSPMNYLTATAPNFTASCYISSCAPLTTVTTSPSAALTTVVTTLPNEETTALALKCADQNLTNTVVYEGSPTSFPSVNNGQAVKWEVSSSSDFLDENQPITNYDDRVVPQFSSTYAVTKSQLTIFNATVEPQGSMPYATAGLYTLSYQHTNCTTAANLIVISSGPTCSCSVNDPSTTVTLSCSVDFAGFHYQPNYPILTWSNSTSTVQQDQPIPSQITSYLQESNSQLQISSNDPTMYRCQLTFSTSTPSSQPSNIATNAPDFTATCVIISCGIPYSPEVASDGGAAKSG